MKKIYNIPNALSVLRIILGISFFFLIIKGASQLTIFLVFLIGALSDTLDGNLARIFKWRTEFGRILDPIADRIFIVSVILGLLFIGIDKILLLMILSREITCLPALIFVKKLKPKFKVLPIGKATTFSQGVTVGSILLKFTTLSYILAIITMLLGIISGYYYTKQAIKEKKQ